MKKASKKFECNVPLPPGGNKFSQSAKDRFGAEVQKTPHPGHKSVERPLLDFLKKELSSDGGGSSSSGGSSSLGLLKGFDHFSYLDADTPDHPLQESIWKQCDGEDPTHPVVDCHPAAGGFIKQEEGTDDSRTLLGEELKENPGNVTGIPKVRLPIKLGSAPEHFTVPLERFFLNHRDLKLLAALGHTAWDTEQSFQTGTEWMPGRGGNTTPPPTTTSSLPAADPHHNSEQLEAEEDPAVQYMLSAPATFHESVDILRLIAMCSSIHTIFSMCLVNRRFHASCFKLREGRAIAWRAASGLWRLCVENAMLLPVAIAPDPEMTKYLKPFLRSLKRENPEEGGTAWPMLTSLDTDLDLDSKLEGAVSDKSEDVERRKKNRRKKNRRKKGGGGPSVLLSVFHADEVVTGSYGSKPHFVTLRLCLGRSPTPYSDDLVSKTQQGTPWPSNPKLHPKASGTEGSTAETCIYLDEYSDYPVQRGLQPGDPDPHRAPSQLSYRKQSLYTPIAVVRFVRLASWRTRYHLRRTIFDEYSKYFMAFHDTFSVNYFPYDLYEGPPWYEDLHKLVYVVRRIPQRGRKGDNDVDAIKWEGARRIQSRFRLFLKCLPAPAVWMPTDGSLPPLLSDPHHEGSHSSSSGQLKQVEEILSAAAPSVSTLISSLELPDNSGFATRQRTSAASSSSSSSSSSCDPGQHNVELRSALMLILRYLFAESPEVLGDSSSGKAL